MGQAQHFEKSSNWKAKSIFVATP
ncbi:protein of unknown function [Microbacterium sp. Nx66]|nr:protein of unknown function [Microbacterium sp. Nx66]